MKCKGASCKCSGDQVKADGYCSDNCRQGGTGQCHCGHAACRK